MTTDLDVDERVEIGARFLDDTVPNWRNLVSLDRLDMGSMYSCVLGQLYGWPLGVKALEEWWEITEPRAYDEPLWEVAGFEKSVSTYPELQRAWERVIRNEPECDGCDQDPWRQPVHYGTCPLNTLTTV